MKLFFSLALILALCLSLASADAEAKRLGGNRSTGMQRQTTAPKAPDASPAPSAANAPAAAPTAAPVAPPKRSWMGPLAGIAAGLGLAALASHFGLGGELASMVMMGLALMAAFAVLRFVMRKRASATPFGGMHPGPMQYATADAGSPPQPSRHYAVSMPAAAIGAANGDNQRPPQIPTDFDLHGFVRNAKVQFIRLQASNDAGNLDDIRQFTTPEMFAELKMDIVERAGAAQQTEVVSVEAQVLEVASEPERFVVSVRFTGMVREAPGTAAESFEEVWHLVKSRTGNDGWLLAGIQQAA